MTVGATAITLFHPPSDPEQFGHWAAGYLAAASNTRGYVGARQSVQRNGHLDWALEVSFENVDLRNAWLDNGNRQDVLSEGQARGFWRCASDPILAPGELPPANAGVFPHGVAPGKEAEFVAAQSNLTSSSSVFPGYEGTALFPADSSGLLLAEALAVPDFKGMMANIRDGGLRATGKVIEGFTADQRKYYGFDESAFPEPSSKGPVMLLLSNP